MPLYLAGVTHDKERLLHAMCRIDETIPTPKDHIPNSLSRQQPILAIVIESRKSCYQNMQFELLEKEVIWLMLSKGETLIKISRAFSRCVLSYRHQDKSRECTLHDEGMKTFGRGDFSHNKVQQQTISRQHCQITFSLDKGEKAQLKITDLGSVGGTAILFPQMQHIDELRRRIQNKA